MSTKMEGCTGSVATNITLSVDTVATNKHYQFTLQLAWILKYNKYYKCVEVKLSERIEENEENNMIKSDSKFLNSWS